jgi:hypothetical protein
VVKGLDVFRQHFSAHTDQYSLIGGTAATIAMREAGLEFRATKDLDLVLHVEVLDRKFGEAFWAFIEKGGYAVRQASTGRPIVYRFEKPTEKSYPYMLELFSRTPEGMDLFDHSLLTPIPMDEAVASLSAIVLDDEYYEFVRSGRRTEKDLSWVGEDRLIPLKANAWLNLTERRAGGEQIDSDKIKKHARDIVRLSQLLTPATRIESSPRILLDLARFMSSLQASVEDRPDPIALGVQSTLEEVLDRIALAYGISR